ncbi:MAG: ABC transporter permease subunit, partial [Bacillati bacterium ANGP1]
MRSGGRIGAVPHPGPTVGASMVVIDQITKNFGRAGTAALSSCSLDVPGNEILCVIGPSGCGKTTLLLINGTEVTAPRPDVAMVFQHFGLLPWKTVQDNVAYGLRVQGRPEREIADAVPRYVDLIGLRGFEGSYPYQLSGGMQQRVGLARALAVNPMVLLMDEPFGSLDAQTRELMQEELLRVWRRQPKTMIFVTHSIDEAVILGDRVALMTRRPGRVKEIIEVGISRPRDPERVARAYLAPAEGRSRGRRRTMSVAAERGRAAGRREGVAGLSPTAIRVLSVMVGVLAWEAYGRAVHSVLFTYPSAVVRAAYELIAAGELQFYLKSSVVVLSLGLVLAIVLGIPLGVLMGRRAVIEHAVDPYVNALYATPLVAVIPVIVVWLGFQTKAKVVLVFLFCIFPILINTYQGVKNTDARLVQVARSFCSKEWRLWRDLILPSSAPFILAGIRLAIGRGLIGMVVAEFYT